MASRARERRRRAHLRAQAREARRVKRRLRRRIVRFFLIGFGGLGAIAIVLSLVLPRSLTPAQSTTASGAGVQVASQGLEHIEVGEEHPPYNTTPPTSGWHYDQPDAPALWGIHEEPIPDEVQVHNLEHGGVMVQYDCPEGCPDLVGQLEEIVNGYPEGVILAPYPDMETAIALTAWGWIDTFEEFDRERIERFILEHKDRGPESLR